MPQISLDSPRTFLPRLPRKLLATPTKRMFTLDNAAHSVAFEQFEAFDTIMRETVLPETYPER